MRTPTLFFKEPNKGGKLLKSSKEVQKKRRFLHSRRAHTAPFFFFVLTFLEVWLRFLVLRASLTYLLPWRVSSAYDNTITFVCAPARQGNVLWSNAHVDKEIVYVCLSWLTVSRGRTRCSSSQVLQFLP